jgi:hypothetical protein
VAKIRFEEENHKYLLGEVSLRSVTSILSELSPEFNANYISKGSAYKRILGEDEYKRLRKEVFGFNFKPDQDLLFPVFDPLCGGEDKVKLIQQEFLQEWEDSGTRGTAFHKERELESIARGYEINPWTGRKSKVITYDKTSDNEVYDMDIFSLPDGYYTELLVYDKTLPIENTICGTIDRLWIETIDGVRYSSTGDFKTNSNAPKNDKFSRMKPPLEHLWANKITNYSLQASWYQMMLESHGFTPKDAAFTWYKDYDVNQSKDYPVIIMRKEIELIREYVKNLYLPNINS